MNKKHLRTLMHERDEILTGKVAPAESFTIIRDGHGASRRIDHDPEECRAQRARDHASRVRAAREKMKLTQDEFSQVLGVSRRT